MSDLILVVDDEPKIVKLAQDYLEKNGYQVASAGDGATALAAFRRDKPDLVVLDLNLPGMDGLAVCRAIRHEADTPIIMLTARVDEVDRLIGLELGADDYITKPFSPRELVARVKAVLRRSRGSVQHPALVRAGDVQLDLKSRDASRDGHPLPLTRIEFDLLAILVQHPGQTFTREQLLDRIHGDASFGGYDRSVDAHVRNLRRKLEPDPDEPRYILTVYGVGYKLSEAAG
jgi:two-component system alkaline phosphatase synthesis response regulator PhoP